MPDTNFPCDFVEVSQTGSLANLRHGQLALAPFGALSKTFSRMQNCSNCTDGGKLCSVCCVPAMREHFDVLQ